MGSMDDDHLIRALECEPAIMRTPVELELIRRFYDLAEEADSKFTEDEMKSGTKARLNKVNLGCN